MIYFSLGGSGGGGSGSDLITKLFTYTNNSISSTLIFNSALPLNETIALSMLDFKNLPSNINLTEITRETNNSFNISYTITSGTFTLPETLEATISKNLFDKDYFNQDINENSAFNDVKIELVVPQGTALGLSKTKANDEWAIGVWCDNLNGGSLGYYGPVLIGLTQTAVDYNDGFYLTQVEYGGVTYYANSNRWIGGSSAKPEDCELVYSTSDLFNDGRITSGYVLADVVTAALNYYFGF